MAAQLTDNDVVGDLKGILQGLLDDVEALKGVGSTKVAAIEEKIEKVAADLQGEVKA